MCGTEPARTPTGKGTRFKTECASEEVLTPHMSIYSNRHSNHTQTLTYLQIRRVRFLPFH